MESQKSSESMSAKNSNPDLANLSQAATGSTPWNQGIRAELQQLIETGAGQNLPVVFDFDNTVIRGDIGEATMAVLARSGQLTPKTVPATLCPVFQSPGQERRELQTCADVVEYYLALLSPTAHGKNDPSPYATGYSWAVEAMTSLRLTDVVEASRTAIASSQSPTSRFIEVTSNRTSILVPTFYPEMVELLAELIRNEFDVWIVSASNVWSVRYMVLEALNPLLRERNARAGIRADHVIGISTLLTDDQNRLFKDAILVKENAAYASLSADATKSLRLTSHLQYPLPTYSGKLACIYDAIGRQPYLGAGDGPGDRAMVDICEHQLWIEPQHSPQIQPVTARLFRSANKPGWKTPSNTRPPWVKLSERSSARA